MNETIAPADAFGHDKAAMARHSERREKLLALTHRIRIGLKDINSRNRPVQDFISDESTKFLGLEADLPVTADGEQRAIEQESGFARSIRARRRAMRQRQDERPTFFKDISAHRLFLIRMNHEKRLPEYRARVAEEIQRQGASNAGQKWRVACQVRSEFGYIKNMERVKFMERVMRESESMRGVHGEGALAEAAARERAIKSSRAFEAAVASLPATAPANVETAWVRSHPAMYRKSRLSAEMKDDPILLTAKDVLRSSVGRAPSKGAVAALQHWANRPEEFFKQLLTEQKKSGTNPDDIESAPSSSTGDDEPSDVDRLLASMEHSVKVPSNESK